MNSRQIDFIAQDCANVLTQPELLNNLKNEVIFISGGTGFMGSWLLELISYLNQHHDFGTKVIVASRNASKSKARLPHLFAAPWVELIDSDIINFFDIPKEVSWVIHGAATPDNRVHSSDPLRVIQTITSGTNNVLDAATRLPNLKKFLNVSSGLVYGKQPHDQMTVETGSFGALDPATTTSAYAESKRMAETLCFVYKAQFRMPVVNVRPFAFIGPYQQLDRPWAINNFLNDAFHGGPVRILGAADTVRSYMYPSDMAFWILSLLANGTSGTTLNLGSPDGHTLREVADEVVGNFSNDIPVSANNSQKKGSKSVFVPDTSRANESLNLSLTVDFKTAIQKTADWFQLKD